MKRILPNKALVDTLRCPICSSNMELKFNNENNSASLLCGGVRRHCYDLSSSGYVNLMPSGHTDSGDSKSAVMARKRFLNLELYRPVADALCGVLSEYMSPSGSVVIDAGCGEGYYTAALARQGFTVAGVDISKHAAEAAAKRAASDMEFGFFGVGSVYKLPFLDNCADAIINVFAPCVEEEFERVLRRGGILAVVYAGPEHLWGLKSAIYDQIKENDERADMPSHMTLVDQRRVRFDITVEGSDNIQDLFAMTPYYWRTSPADSEKLRGLDSLRTAVDMIIAVYKKD